MVNLIEILNTAAFKIECDCAGGCNGECMHSKLREMAAMPQCYIEMPYDDNYSDEPNKYSDEG